MTDLDPHAVLDLPMQQPNDANADTIRGYLTALLAALWQEGEGFSGKRPLGNSGWDWDLYVPLIRAGMIRGEIDEYGGIADVDEPAGSAAIAAAILAMGEPAVTR